MTRRPSNSFQFSFQSSNNFLESPLVSDRSAPVLLLLCLGVEHRRARPRAAAAHGDTCGHGAVGEPPGPEDQGQAHAGAGARCSLSIAPPPAGCSSAPLAAPRAPALRLLRRAHLPRSRRRSRSARRWRSGPARSSRTSAASSVRAPPLLCVVCWLAARPCDRLCLLLCRRQGLRAEEAAEQDDEGGRRGEEGRGEGQLPAPSPHRSPRRSPHGVGPSACSAHTRWREQAKSAKAATTKKVDDEDLDPRMCAQLHQPAERPAGRSG